MPASSRKKNTRRKSASRASSPERTPAKRRVDFKIHAPTAHEVFVAGSFNDWDPSAKALRRGKDSVWRTWTNLPRGDHQYRFIVDGQWVEDPECEDRQPNPFGSYNSLLKV